MDRIMQSNILLTGRPGIGKTTAIRKIVDALGEKRVGGFWSSEMRKEGRRIGFSINTLSGINGVLAHIDFTFEPRVGKYRVNVQDIDEIAVPALASARKERRIIIVDEIASMELYSDKFRNEIKLCLDTKGVLGTIQMKHHPVLNVIRAREDVSIFTLTEKNRNLIPDKVIEIIHSFLSEYES